MKRKVAMILCVAMLFCAASVVFTAEGITKFKLKFMSASSYQTVVSDTTSE